VNRDDKYSNKKKYDQITLRFSKNGCVGFQGFFGGNTEKCLVDSPV